MTDIMEGGEGVDRETDEKDVRLGIGKWAESVIVLLASCND